MVKLKESRIIWPLVLFPFAIGNAHTLSFTGRCWVKDIKASFSFSNIILTDTNLTCRYRLFNLLIFHLPLRQVDDIKKIENKPGLILIKFRAAIYGKLAKFALSGKPPGSKNKVIINVKDEQSWITRLKLLSA